MSYLQQRLALGFVKIIDRAGTPIRLQYFSTIFNGGYDDDISLVQSGTDLWTSGVVFPLSKEAGHSDSILLEQGKLLLGDTKLFIHGSIVLTGSEMNIKITVGSPASPDTNYSLIPGFRLNVGPDAWSVANTPIYKVLYIRKIGGTGSFLGEQ